MMKQENPSPQRTSEQLRHALADLVRESSPAISKFAAWALEHPDEIALFSIRELADRAGANVNTVFRFAQALGYAGYEDCRRNFRTAMLRRSKTYGDRAAQLVGRSDADLLDGIRFHTGQNVDAILAEDNGPLIRSAAKLLGQARRVYCVGVRSSFSLAHHFAYSGRMAFPQFERPIVESGSILDLLSETTEQDVAVLITFSPYSSELIRAHGVAQARGAQIIALTDSYTSPIAAGASHVFTLPMQGPQTLPSLTAGFALVEALVSEMIASDEDAPARIARLETLLLDAKAYVSE